MERIVDIYFVGGFGTVQWLTPEEYLGSTPDTVVLDAPPPRVLQMLTDTYSKQVGSTES